MWYNVLVKQLHIIFLFLYIYVASKTISAQCWDVIQLNEILNFPVNVKYLVSQTMERTRSRFTERRSTSKLTYEVGGSGVQAVPPASYRGWGVHHHHHDTLGGGGIVALTITRSFPPVYLMPGKSQVENGGGAPGFDLVNALYSVCYIKLFFERIPLGIKF